MWTGRRRATRGFVAASVAALAVPAAVVGWLGWQLLQQDRQLEHQRVQERLTAAADLAVGSLDRKLSSTEQRLVTLVEAREPDTAAAAAGLSADRDDAAVVVIAATGLRSSAPLLYYPEEPDFFDPAAGTFAAQEHLEFVEKDLNAALAGYRQLAASGDRHVKAGALARAGRVARGLDQPQVALQMYDALAALGSTPALGRPADLVASLERCAIFYDAAGPRNRLSVEATQLNRRLLAADWRLSRSQFHFYRERLTMWLGVQPTAVPDEASLSARETIAAGVLVAARSRLDATAANHTSGRETFGSGLDQGIVIWRRSSDSVAALVATLAYADRMWFRDVRAIEEGHRARLSLVTGTGEAWFGDAASPETVRRAALETGLPFTIRVATSDPDGDAALFPYRRRLLAGVVAALGLIVLVSGYVTARGLARELAAARLQSDFVAAVSHEFRTPVASVRQLSELLDEGRVPNESRRAEYYGLLRHESVRLQRLVENLLDFGRMESAAAEYRLEPVDLAELLREITTDFRGDMRSPERRVDLHLKNALSPVHTVHADREALGRAVWNLLDNAAKYSPRESPITVEAESSAAGIAIRVHDDGGGIPLEEHERIFDKFVRGASAGASKGTGLGLAMVKHIVHAHHGVVNVDSRPGSGTTFTIVLPGTPGLSA